MSYILYEFTLLSGDSQKNYITQIVKDRRLTDIYHSHDFFELIWFLNGEGTERVNGEKLTSKKGDVLLLRPNDSHCFLSQSDDVMILSLSVKREEFEVFANAFDPRLLSALKKCPKPPHVTLTRPLDLTRLPLPEHITEYDSKLLLSLFLNYYIALSDKLDAREKMPKMLEGALAEMNKKDNLRGGIGAFVELSHYSRSHLSRLVREYFGVTLKQYINELRLKSAYSDLILTNKPIEEISEEIGFSSFSHFQKIFKAKFSETPSVVRKNAEYGRRKPPEKNKGGRSVGTYRIEPAPRSEDTGHILSFLLEEYCCIFGFDKLNTHDVVIFNDPSAPCPRFIIASPLRIRLAQKGLDRWSQTVYQLSHELCHLALHTAKENKNLWLSWFEEPLCEAVSLYALWYSSRNWKRCALSKNAPRFGRHHKTYLDDTLAERVSSGLWQCNTVEKLRAYESVRTSEKAREGHRAERNYLYQAILNDPLSLKSALNYSKYLREDRLTIDFDRWQREDSSPFLGALREIQPVRFFD